MKICHFCKKTEDEYYAASPEIIELRYKKDILRKEAETLNKVIESERYKRNELIKKHNELVRKIKQIKEQKIFKEFNTYEFGGFKELEKYIKDNHFNEKWEFDKSERIVYVCQDCNKYIKEYERKKREKEFGYPIPSEEERGINVKLNGIELDEAIKSANEKFKDWAKPNPLEE